MSEKLQDIFSSSDLDLAHAGGMSGITSCSACRACVRHPDAVSGNDTEAKVDDLHAVVVISVAAGFVNNDIIPL